jgi:hypothetical protein
VIRNYDYRVWWPRLMIPEPLTSRGLRAVMSDTVTQSSEDVLRILGNLQTAVEATSSSVSPLLTK